MKYFVNGIWTQDPMISVFDIGFLRGVGVFDYTRTYNRKPFKLQPHLERFKRSASLFGIALPYSIEEIDDLIRDGIKQNPGMELGIRCVLTPGLSTGGLKAVATPTFIIMFHQLEEPEPSLYQKGVGLVTHTELRGYPEAKSNNYMAAYRGMRVAEEKAAFDILYVNGETNEVYESSTSNLFYVKNDEVFCRTTDVLEGITQKVVKDLVLERGWVLRSDENYSLDDILAADECFLTASNKEVLPVVSIDDKTIGDGKPGPITLGLLGDYRRVIAEESGIILDE